MNQHASALPRGKKYLVPPDALTVELSSPFIIESLQRALLQGVVRTVPAGPGRVAVLPTKRHPDPRAARNAGR